MIINDAQVVLLSSGSSSSPLNEEEGDYFCGVKLNKMENDANASVD
jgi:hypothetical protein